jgi:hypothetical protein
MLDASWTLARSIRVAEGVNDLDPSSSLHSEIVKVPALDRQCIHNLDSSELG